MIFLFLRRLSPRARLITSAILVVAGLAVVAVSTVVAGLLIHGIALIVIGAAMYTSVLAKRRRAQPTADQPLVDDELASEVNANVR